MGVKFEDGAVGTIENGTKDRNGNLILATPSNSKVEGVGPDPDSTPFTIREPIIEENTVDYVEIDGQKYRVQERQVPNNTQPVPGIPDSLSLTKSERYIVTKDGQELIVRNNLEYKEVSNGPFISDAPEKKGLVPISVPGVFDEKGNFHPIKKGYYDEERGLQPTRKQILEDLKLGTEFKLPKYSK
ncbi:MAG TPA: hypothetical protein PK957_00835 [Candidatus Dojkabacteria bacterium]|nr:hypothetical protein [Candidatus Dojkabacteria bacterium]